MGSFRGQKTNLKQLSRGYEINLSTFFYKQIKLIIRKNIISRLQHGPSILLLVLLVTSPLLQLSRGPDTSSFISITSGKEGRGNCGYQNTLLSPRWR